MGFNDILAVFKRVLSMKCRFDDPIVNYISNEVTVLNENLSVQDALAQIRKNGISNEKIIYFYVCNNDEQLTGVLPTRKLLIAALESRISEIMLENVIAIPAEATVMEACEMFTMYKFLAYPVIDDNRKILGIVDINLLTEEMFNIGERQRAEEIFETVGFRISQMKNASVFKAFRLRFPWLTATVASGMLCALLSSVYEATLAQNILLAFFLTLVLGLGESATVQALTLTIYSLKHERISAGWFLREFKRQALLAFMMGLACGIIVFVMIAAWKGIGLSGISIALSITFSLVTACLTGVAIPTLLHTLKLDPKIASGPVALAVSDVFTIIIYFTIAQLLL